MNLSAHEIVNMQHSLSITFDKIKDKLTEHREDILIYLKEKVKLTDSDYVDPYIRTAFYHTKK